MDEFKREYDNIEIPQELSQVVQGSIDKALFEIISGEKASLEGEGLEELSMGQMGTESNCESRKVVEIDKERAKRVKMMKKRVMGIAAAAVVMFGGFGVGVNTSPAFADTVADMPVLGSLAKIFTIQQEYVEDDVYVSVSVPGVEGLNNPELEKKINALVQEEVNDAIEDTKEMLAEEKATWLAAGGDEADYVEREILVDYKVNHMSEDFISFTVYKTETLASAYFDMFHYNYDLKTGEEVTLESVLGADYKTIVEEQVLAEITKREAADENNVFMVDRAIEIDEDQAFYVNGKGNVVVVFNKYEIAPGYMGIQEFEIVK